MRTGINESTADPANDLQKKILVVEDEGIVAIEIQSRLKNLGYGITGVASSAEEAMKLAELTRPALVLMDIKLKGEMDGIQAAEWIRSNLDTPVVYLTAYTDDGTLQRAKITQPFGYLIKPFEERELHTTIEISLYNHQMERRLQISEARYRAVSELTSDFAFSLKVEKDGSYSLEWMTDAFPRITGYSIEEIAIPKELERLVYPDDISLVLKHLRPDPTHPDAVADHPASFDYRIISKNGEIKWLHGSTHPIFEGESRRLVRIYAAAKDVTARKNAEELIRIQRDLGIALSFTRDLTDALGKLLEATIQVSGIDCGALYLVDEETGGIVLAAHEGLPHQFIDITSFGPDSPQVKLVMKGEAIYGHYTEITTPLDEIDHTSGLKALAIIPVKHEGRIVAALNLASHGQDEIPVNSRNALEAISSQIGGIIAWVKAEMALRESEENYRLITEGVSEGIFQLDLSGTARFVNPSFDRLFGYLEGEFIGHHYSDLVHQMHLPEMKILMDDTFLGNYIETELDMQRKDGQRFPAFISAGPIRKDGTIIGLIGIVRRL